MAEVDLKEFAEIIRLMTMERLAGARTSNQGFKLLGDLCESVPPPIHYGIPLAPFGVPVEIDDAIPRDEIWLGHYTGEGLNRRLTVDKIVNLARIENPPVQEGGK